MATAELEEYRALENFRKLATPTQWSIHSVLKPKVKLWSTKIKNYQIATRRVEYDLPPNFISRIDLTFKIDESILDRDEAQGFYNEMRQLVKDHRTQAMTLYLKSITREREVLWHEIRNIIDGFPRENNNNNDNNNEMDVDEDDGGDASGLIAFKRYHDLREIRLGLEAEQSTYFLVVERVEGDMNEEREEIVAPTLIRSLGADFLLQQ